MPEYRGQPCEGFCESFTLPCLRPEHFVETAEHYDAIPVAPSGTFKVDGEDVPWTHTLLNIQDEGRREEMFGDLAAAFLKRDPQIGEELAMMNAKAWLKQFPCFLGCDIVARCGYCGLQHERKYIHDGTCEIKVAQDAAKETGRDESHGNGDDEDDALVEEYNDERGNGRWLEGDGNGQSNTEGTGE